MMLHILLHGTAADVVFLSHIKACSVQTLNQQEAAERSEVLPPAVSFTPAGEPQVAEHCFRLLDANFRNCLTCNTTTSAQDTC